MNRQHEHEDEELRHALADAAREADAVDASVARRRAWRAHSGERRTRRRTIAALALVAFIGGVTAWTLLDVEGPSDQQLQHGREVVLMLASDWTRDYIQRHGQVPTSADLPAATGVKVERVPNGVRLSLPNGNGPSSAVTVPLPESR